MNDRYYWEDESEDAYSHIGMSASTEQGPLAGVLYRQWLADFGSVWRQGEHVVLIGPTGSGKTHVSSDILDYRSYVAALSIKPHDDTLTRFLKRTPRYVKVKEWPPNVLVNRCVFICKPSRLGDSAQSGRVREVLNGVHKSEGWTVVLDDIAYIVNRLRLRSDVVDLLNVGRSSGITIVGALQQPTSISANVPSEMKKQTKHLLLWKFTGDDEIEACSRMCGISKKIMHDLMSSLQYHDGATDRYSDFIWVRRGYVPMVVRVS